MIAGIFHQGSGLGNQLHRYVMARVLAEDKGYEFGMANPHLFKGSFMKINMGKQFWGHENLFTEKKVVENGIDIRSYDPEINFVEDNTLIDGEFQDERYFGHRLEHINDWLHVERLNIPDDVCIIGFRGGEYKGYPDLFLDWTYWTHAKQIMLNINRNMKFRVVTDDPASAKEFFPNDEITHEIGMDWRSVRFAQYSIIANSSFYIFPRLLRHLKSGPLTIAPRYWARRNTQVWALPQNYYKQFTYI